MDTLRAALVGSERADKDLDETESALNALIERRAANAEHADDPQSREESWKESERAFRAERREALRYQWIAYYRLLARNHANLSERFREKADAL